MTERKSNLKHQIRQIKSKTGTTNIITVSKEATKKFQDCSLYETVLSDGILLTSGCSHIEEKNIRNSHLRNFEVIEDEEKDIVVK